MKQIDYISNSFAQQYITALSGVIVPIDFMALCDDNPFDAILLAQIIYWYRPNKLGKRKLQIYKEGHWWIAKKHSDWYSECRIKERTVRRCLERLQASKLIVYKVSGFAGMTIPHLRMNWEVFETKIKALQEAIDLKGQLTPEVNHEASDLDERLTPEVSPFDLKGQGQLTPEVNPNTETTTEITTLKTKDSSSDESSLSDSPIDESGPEIKTETSPVQATESGPSQKAEPATKTKNNSAVQAEESGPSQKAKSDKSDLSQRGDSPPPYAYDFDNNPLSRADFDARLTSFKTMTTAVYFIYDHPKAKTKLVPSQVAKIAHQLLGSDKTKEGKKITGLRKKFAFTEQPATPQEVIAFGIWHKRDGGWIPSQKAEELHEQFTEYRNVAYHERFMELADSQLRNLLRIRIGAPFPKHEIAPADPVIDVDKLLTEMAGEISAQQQATSDENQKNKIKWSQETARHYQLYRASAVPGTIRRSYYVD